MIDELIFVLAGFFSYHKAKDAVYALKIAAFGKI